MNTSSDAAGLAALSICESLLLSLIDSNVMDEPEALAILADAAAAHRNAMLAGDRAALHQNAAEAIELIAAGRNSIQGV